MHFYFMLNVTMLSPTDVCVGLFQDTEQGRGHLVISVRGGLQSHKSSIDSSNNKKMISVLYFVQGKLTEG